MTGSDPHKIVILDKNPNRRDYLRSIVSEWGHIPFLFEKESSCLDNISPLNPDFISNNGFDDVAVIDESLSAGEIQAVINKVLDDKCECRNRRHCPLIIGNSPAMVRIKRLVSELNRLNETVLIQGESGTGKDLLAQVIHLKSNRHAKPFIKVNVPDMSNIIDKQDDQHSNHNPREIFALAENGTLFLDGIGDMTSAFQVELLHYFDENRMWSSGKNTDGIRVIASTVHDLEILIAGGVFRKDLYYRLNVTKIKIPPLRKRAEDIPQLADFFTDRFCQKIGKSHYELLTKTKDIFNGYFWPGNVGELEHLVGHMVSNGNEEEIIEKFYRRCENKLLLTNSEGILLAAEIAKVRKILEASDSWSLKEIGQKFLTRIEKTLMKKALESTNWNRRKAALLLNISYKSLLNKMKEYNLTQRA
jgi:two-component system response regulator AtoC